MPLAVTAAIAFIATRVVYSFYSGQSLLVPITLLGPVLLPVGKTLCTYDAGNYQGTQGADRTLGDYVRAGISTHGQPKGGQCTGQYSDHKQHRHITRRIALGHTVSLEQSATVEHDSRKAYD